MHSNVCDLEGKVDFRKKKKKKERKNKKKRTWKKRIIKRSRNKISEPYLVEGDLLVLFTLASAFAATTRQMGVLFVDHMMPKNKVGVRVKNLFPRRETSKLDMGTSKTT